jgi:hypothetical protein
MGLGPTSLAQDAISSNRILLQSSRRKVGLHLFASPFRLGESKLPCARSKNRVLDAGGETICVRSIGKIASNRQVGVVDGGEVPIES